MVSAESTFAVRSSAADSLAEADPRFLPYRQAHRLLRGRYRYVIPLVLICGLAAAAIEYKTQHKLYRSEGLIHIAPELPEVMQETDQNEPMQMYNEYVQSQVLLLTSRPVVALALTDPKLKAAFGKQPLPAIDGFGHTIEVLNPHDTEAIWVRCTCPDPEIAAATVRALIGAYLHIYGQGDVEDQLRRAEVLADKQHTLEQQIAQITQAMQQAAIMPSANTIAVNDDLMRSYLTQQSALDSALSGMIAAGYGQSRPEVVAVKARLQGVEQRIDAYREDYAKTQLVIAIRPGANTAPGIYPELRGYEQTLEQLRKELDETISRQDVLNTEARLGAKRVKVQDWGKVPVQPFVDSRRAMAAVFGVFGAAAPLMLFLVAGMIDRRSRFSDQAQDSIDALPLLGVVPELPKRVLNDEDARAVAHCVHNLRIRLQALTPSEAQRVFMMTSAAPGEGKTSLTLSLGFSFASTGASTLLIDCDIIGRGLTHRLKGEDTPGLTDGLDDPYRAHIKHVAPNLWLLPAGQAGVDSAMSLSSRKLRKLLAVAASAYDVVLVDTGPILFSIDAPVVAQQASSVVLVVAQGQYSDSARRAVKMLQSIGARLAGFVFNRATRSDYHRSIGGSSHSYYKSAKARKSAATESKDPTQPYGPLARSVALFMPTDSDGHPPDHQPAASRPIGSREANGRKPRPLPDPNHGAVVTGLSGAMRLASAHSEQHDSSKLMFVAESYPHPWKHTIAEGDDGDIGLDSACCAANSSAEHLHQGTAGGRGNGHHVAAESISTE